MKALTLAMALSMVGSLGCEVTMRDNATSPDPTTPSSDLPKPTSTPNVEPTAATTQPIVSAQPTAAPTIAPENPNQAIAMGVVGTWSSPKCEKRTYERIVSFDEKGGFVAEDRVSPCPKDVRCVWSGIAISKGTFNVDKGKVNLTVTEQGKGGQPLPASFSWDTALKEGSCAYTKK